MSTPLPPNERCDRCGAGFRCGVDDDQPCACTTLVLPPELLQLLRAQYPRCLCLACLRSLAASQVAPSAPVARP